MKNLVEIFLENDFLISPSFLDRLDMGFDLDGFLNKLSEKFRGGKRPLVLHEDLVNLLFNGSETVADWEAFEKARVLFGKSKDSTSYEKPVSLNNVDAKADYPPKAGDNAPLILSRIYNEKPGEVGVGDFVSYFRTRYNFLSKLLRNRLELRATISIGKLNNRNGEVAVIGLVNEKKINKNGGIILKLEDPTGYIEVFVNKEKKCYDIAKDAVLDEVIGVSGTLNSKTIFANGIYFPDTPSTKEIKKADREILAAFISDVHVGSRLFLEENLLKFIGWLNGDLSGEHAKIAEKVKYLFIIGDLVDGVGVYPEQEKELKIPDIRRQYSYSAQILSKIRKDIKIIICPGQHDALRVSEPQPPFNKEFAIDFYNLPNVYLVSNPAMVNIASSEKFEGFNILLYHGASFHYFISNVDSLRLNNARDNPSIILKFLLQKRHLAPSHGATMYVPNKDNDPLLIDVVPDIFASGDMHRSSTLNYKNIIIINCSCWQSKTDFQEKTGNNPDPCRVPIVNLKTREVKILDFS